MVNIAEAAQSSLSIISLVVYDVQLFTNKSKYSHVTNLFLCFPYAKYVVNKMLQKLKNPATPVPSI